MPDTNRPDPVGDPALIDVALRLQAAQTDGERVAVLEEVKAAMGNASRDQAGVLIKQMQIARSAVLGRTVHELVQGDINTMGLNGMDEEEFERIYVFGNPPSLQPPAAP